jgi:hypothetical protein
VAKATNLLVNDMGFPLDAVKDALASCDTGRDLDLDTVIAMLVSASSKPAINPSVTPTVRLVHDTELDSLPFQAAPHSQPQPRIPPQDTRRSLRKKQDKSAYSAQTKLDDFVGGSKGCAEEALEDEGVSGIGCYSGSKGVDFCWLTFDKRVSFVVK